MMHIGALLDAIAKTDSWRQGGNTLWDEGDGQTFHALPVIQGKKPTVLVFDESWCGGEFERNFFFWNGTTLRQATDEEDEFWREFDDEQGIRDSYKDDLVWLCAQDISGVQRATDFAPSLVTISTKSPMTPKKVRR